MTINQLNNGTFGNKNLGKTKQTNALTKQSKYSVKIRADKVFIFFKRNIFDKQNFLSDFAENSTPSELLEISILRREKDQRWLPENLVSSAINH